MSGDTRILIGDCRALLRTIADESVAAVITSPPYNIGKEYETPSSLEEYIDFQTGVLRELIRVIRPGGSLHWQVGNYVDKRVGEVIPLDAVTLPIIRSLGMRIRNRIVWTFGHGLHCTKRFSGRHETVLWATKGDYYLFDVDPVRVPQKYPNKRYFKGPRKGELSGNPLGKNPGDVWDISNVKHNHPEKTAHPCQFPEELVERLMLSTTRSGDTVLDPYGGSGTVAVVAKRFGRRSILMEMEPSYVDIANERLVDLEPSDDFEALLA